MTFEHCFYQRRDTKVIAHPLFVGIYVPEPTLCPSLSFFQKTGSNKGCWCSFVNA